MLPLSKHGTMCGRCSDPLGEELCVSVSLFFSSLIRVADQVIIE